MLYSREHSWSAGCQTELSIEYHAAELDERGLDFEADKVQCPSTNELSLHDV